ncbi:MAG: DUF1834 family protein [Pseudomonadota bacterium]|nr:DUF1834 family protein [Pseudomonadota bacterium]
MIGAVENAILARLKAASDAGALGYKLMTLESYPASWDVYLRDKVIRAPGAWVVFAGFREGSPIGHGGLRAKGHYGLVLMAENMRNETAQRHGGPVAGEPGSYQLVEDSVALLQGWDTGVDGASAVMVESCHVVSSLAIKAERKISLLALELAVPLIFAASPQTGKPIGADGVGDFTTFHSDWDIPPFGGIDADAGTPGVQLPDDAHADAVDQITLET